MPSWYDTIKQKFSSDDTPTPTPRQASEQLPIYRHDELEKMENAMHVDGFVLISGVVPPEAVAEARARIDALAPIHWDHTGFTDHYKNVFNRDAYWLQFLDRPGVVDLAEAALGANCHIIGQTAWRSHPGHRGVPMHLDYLPMEWPPPGVPASIRVPMFICTAHFYLSPQYHELCPTWVVPGSHRAGRRPQLTETVWGQRRAQPVLCSAGDVLVFRSDLWHSGSDNTTPDAVRYLLQVHYGRREMAQHFAPYFGWSFHPDVVRLANPRQRRLLGDHRPGAYD